MRKDDLNVHDFKTETDEAENLIDDFFSNFDISMSDFKWKEYGGTELIPEKTGALCGKLNIPSQHLPAQS